VKPSSIATTVADQVVLNQTAIPVLKQVDILRPDQSEEEISGAAVEQTLR